MNDWNHGCGLSTNGSLNVLLYVTINSCNYNNTVDDNSYQLEECATTADSFDGSVEILHWTNWPYTYNICR